MTYSPRSLARIDRLVDTLREELQTLALRVDSLEAYLQIDFPETPESWRSRRGK